MKEVKDLNEKEKKLICFFAERWTSPLNNYQLKVIKELQDIRK